MSSAPTPDGSDIALSARRPRRFRKRFVTFGVLAILVTVIFVAFDVNESMRSLGDWIDELGWWGPPLFISIHALAVACLIPGAVFPLMAGFLFGPAFGAVYSTLGKTSGALLAFSIARHLIGGHRRSAWLKDMRKRHPKLAVLEHGAVSGGWRSLALIRLIPAIPFKLSSYLFGWTQYTTRDFVLGTLIGTIPYSITNAYLGSLVSSVGGLNEAPLPTTDTGTLLYGAAAVVAFSAALIAGVKARSLLQQAQLEVDSADTDGH